ncbi:ASCH domain-containing protein [Companilactobacillus zhachilii]|uniref:ASCH domain-containing protein n=1 Tax=Companilactobacillus zhachilii TaxID=2304606 RepID=UPI0019246651|nr:ASCH domain-containing protein [Companilactobacillus zhachilii]
MKDIMDMHLNHQPFMAIKNGTKTIEVRLNDEKRSQLKVGDKIKFTDLATGESLITEILELEQFPTFKKLFTKYAGTVIGSPENESIDELYKENQEIYSRQREQKYGALAIRVKLV